MAALTANVQRSKRLHQLRLEAYPVAADTTIYEGAGVCLNASGLAVPAADTAGLVSAGVAHRGFDNAGGAAGVVARLGSERIVEVDVNGPYSFAVDGGTPIAGVKVFWVDDNTVSVAATTNSIPAGRLSEPDSLNPGQWFVDVERVVHV